MLKKIKEFLETQNGKIILFGLSSIIVPIAVNWVNNTFIKFKLFGEESLLNYIVLCLIWAAILVIIVLIVKFFKYLLSKRMTYSDTNKAIKEISKKYIYRSNELNKDKVVETHKREMFTLAEANKNNGMPHTNKKSSENIIYYSFSAKKYLNWIDFVYLRYLKELKEKLDCQIVIGLHYPDYIKECKLPKKEDEKDQSIKDNTNENPNSLEEEFLGVVEYFSKHIKKIIGDDVKIKLETEFYKENSFKYAEDFHFVYVSYSLYYANMIGETVDNKEFTYKDYKRKLSHIESSFPIWMMSEKKKRRRIYVLDNKYSNQIWDIEPLNSIRKIKEIYFIEVNDLNNQNGDRLNVHKEGNCINLTDCPQIINEKIKMLDSVYEKQMMINLLMDYHDKDIEKQKIVGSILKDDCVEINEEEIDNVLLKLIEKLIKQYDIKPASEELCE